MRRINLYTTVGCHLCEQALGLLEQAIAGGQAFEICEVEISESESLLEKYDIRIPVIQIEGEKAELGWPFNAADLNAFLASDNKT